MITNLKIPAFILGILAPVLLPEPEKTNPTTIAENSNSFAFDLYQKVALQEKGNIFLSPFSISTAMAMTYAGTDGTTAEEIAKALHFPPNDEAFHFGYGTYIKKLEDNASGNIELKIANHLWAEKDYKLKSEYVNLNAGAYHSALEKMNFKGDPDKSRITINNWVSERTEKRITNLIPPGQINADTRLVLTNAIYFKGDWLYTFDKESTGTRYFHLSNGSQRQEEFMNLETELDYFENKAYKMVRLPYKGKKQSMIMVLPLKENGFYQLEKEMNPSILKSVFQNYRPKVRLSIPKFKITLPLSLNTFLNQLGIKLAFNEGADFSKMTGSEDLHISSVLHKAFIEIDEKGTEAAAATAVIAVATSLIPSQEEKIKKFVADQPFLFYIIDNETKTVLFMGRILDPGLK